MNKTAYFDVTFGASGDMILASFIDLGLPEEYLVSTIKKLKLPEFGIKAGRVLRNGISALKLDITCPKEHDHRNFKTISGMISSSPLKDEIKELSIKIFGLLADAEAEVHGKSRDEVTFHEVGALDSIIDIVGIAAALDYFGIKSAFHSPIPLCGGTVNCMHGEMPAMSPAAGILLKGRKFYMSDVTDELITPTAAAVINLLTSEKKGAGKDFVYENIGIGAGSKEFETHPNIMRIFLGESSGGVKRDFVTVIETNIDDMNPKLFEPLLESLFKCKGVLDAFTVPVIMKKSRPGFLLKVLLKNASFNEVTDIIFKNSTTIGLRYFDVDRVLLDRTIEKISTKYGEFSVKAAKLRGEIVNVSCEYDECKASAKRLDLSVKEIINHVNAEIEKKYLR
jgi:uncharacterized protein (TIGR00299 family) protein